MLEDHHFFTKRTRKDQSSDLPSLASPVFAAVEADEDMDDMFDEEGGHVIGDDIADDDYLSSDDELSTESS